MDQWARLIAALGAICVFGVLVWRWEYGGDTRCWADIVVAACFTVGTGWAVWALGRWLAHSIHLVYLDGQRARHLCNLVDSMSTMLRRYAGLPRDASSAAFTAGVGGCRITANPADPNQLWMLGELRAVVVAVARRELSGANQAIMSIVVGTLVSVVVLFVVSIATGGRVVRLVEHSIVFITIAAFVDAGTCCPPLPLAPWERHSRVAVVA